MRELIKITRELSWVEWKVILGTFLLIVAFVFRSVGGVFVDPNVAVRTLRMYGYSDIHMLESNWFMVWFRGGGFDDAARFRMAAKNPAGEKVEVCVFVGWPFKGATVRTK